MTDQNSSSQPARIAFGFWIAGAGALVQLASLAFKYYEYKEQLIGAWQGIPHTAHLLIVSAVMTLALIVLIARGRSPLSGAGIAWVVAMLGALAAAQVGYRIAAAPFDAIVPAKSMIIGTHCMYYCWPSQAKEALPLSGIWLALAGSLLVVVGALLSRFSAVNRQVVENFWRAPSQPGLDPWLALIAFAAAGQFVFGFTFFTFYTVGRETGAVQWSGWLAMPHTGALVLLVLIFVSVIAWQAINRRLPSSARSIGKSIAVAGALSTGWTALRIVRPPFSQGPVEIGPAAYVCVLCGVLLVAMAAAYAIRDGRKRA